MLFAEGGLHVTNMLPTLYSKLSHVILKFLLSKRLSVIENASSMYLGIEARDTPSNVRVETHPEVGDSPTLCHRVVSEYSHSPCMPFLLNDD